MYHIRNYLFTFMCVFVLPVSSIMVQLYQHWRDFIKKKSFMHVTSLLLEWTYIDRKKIHILLDSIHHCLNVLSLGHDSWHFTWCTPKFKIHDPVICKFFDDILCGFVDSSSCSCQWMCNAKHLKTSEQMQNEYLRQ